jgi:acyl-CoA synthetase (AMP-forming)/AMP-acid ligase II
MSASPVPGFESLANIALSSLLMLVPRLATARFSGGCDHWRIEGEFGWSLTHAYGLTETSPFITICEPRPEHVSLDPRQRAAVKARQGVELITSGELRVLYAKPRT